MQSTVIVGSKGPYTVQPPTPPLKDRRIVAVDDQGRLTVRNQVLNPATLEWENQQQGTPTGVETEVLVQNWPAMMQVYGTVATDDQKATVVYTDGSIIYVCRAAIGSSTSSPVWQIKRVDTSSGVVITWCDSNANYDNVATDLAIVSGHSYS